MKKYYKTRSEEKYFCIKAKKNDCDLVCVDFTNGTAKITLVKSVFISSTKLQEITILEYQNAINK
jgi:hypothetical protein